MSLPGEFGYEVHLDVVHFFKLRNIEHMLL